MSDYFSQFPESEIWLGNVSVDEIYKDGVELYKHPSFTQRGVMSFTGSQSVTLSTPVPLPADFEIERQILTTEQNTAQTIMSGDNFKLGISAANQLFLSVKRGNGNTATVSIPLTVQLNLINWAIVKRAANVFYLSFNAASASIDLTGVPLSPITITMLSKNSKSIGTQNEFFRGSSLECYVWSGGNRTSGNLVLNLPLDVSSSDYQTNLAVPGGSEKVGLIQPTSTDASWTNLGGGSYKAVASGGAFGRVLWDGFTVGESYRVKFEIAFKDAATSDDSGIKVTSATDLTVWDNSTVSGSREYILVADANVMGFKHDADCNFTISNISIKKWSGGVMQNTLAGDWSQYEQRNGWAFYRKVGAPSIKLEDAA